MKKGGLYGTCVLILAAGVAANCVFAEKQERAQRKQMERRQTEARQGRKGDESFRAFQEEQKARRESHHSRQKQKNEAFRATIKDKTPAEKCLAIKQHRSAQYTGNMAFHKEQHEKRLTFTKSRLSEREAPQERQEEMTSKMEERYQGIRARMQKRHDETMALLDQLASKSDLTHEELHEAMKQLRQTRKEERSNFREQHRKGGRGKEK